MPLSSLYSLFFYPILNFVILIYCYNDDDNMLIYSLWFSLYTCKLETCRYQHYCNKNININSALFFLACKMPQTVEFLLLCVTTFTLLHFFLYKLEHCWIIMLPLGPLSVANLNIFHQSCL